VSSENREPQTARVGFVCLTGPTNAGKSTLMNAVIGQKIAIISPKPQTTRNRILGIHTIAERGQLIFVDTPGLHRPRGKLGERLMEVARRSLRGTDVAVLVVDASLDVKVRDSLSKPNRAAAEEVKSAGLPTVVALNKVDLIPKKELLLPLTMVYSELLGTTDIVPISARKGRNLDALESLLFEKLPEGPLLYPADVLSDQAEKFLAAEIIREKAIKHTKEELPYSVAVEVESWLEPEEEGRVLHIGAIIHVERSSQKGIVIGKGGGRLKVIATEARLELEQMFDTKIFLEIFVHIEKDWSKDQRRLDRFGYK
jgi:GTP-binding protein Era